MNSTHNDGRSESKARVRQGFFPIVVGENVDGAQSGAMAFAAGNDIQLSQGGGNVLLAGNRIIIEKGGGNFLASGSGITIEQGGAGMVLAPEVKFANSYVGWRWADRSRSQKAPASSLGADKPRSWEPALRPPPS